MDISKQVVLKIGQKRTYKESIATDEKRPGEPSLIEGERRGSGELKRKKGLDL